MVLHSLTLMRNGFRKFVKFQRENLTTENLPKKPVALSRPRAPTGVL